MARQITCVMVMATFCLHAMDNSEPRSRNYRDIAVIMALINGNKQNKLRSVRIHAEKLESVAYSGSGNAVAGGACDGMISVLRGNEARRFRNSACCNTIALNHEASLLAVGDNTSEVTIFDLASGCRMNDINCEALPIEARFDNEGKRIVIAADAAGTHLYDVATKTIVNTYREDLDSDGFVASADVREHELVTGAWDRMGVVWDLRTNKRLFGLKHDGLVKSVGLTPKHIMTATSKKVYLWDRSTGALKKEFEKINNDIQQAMVSDDEAHVLVEDRTGVQVWDIGNEKIIFSLETNPIRGAAFSRDAKKMATGTCTGKIKIWNISSYAWKVSDKLIEELTDEQYQLLQALDEDRKASPLNERCLGGDQWQLLKSLPDSMQYALRSCAVPEGGSRIAGTVQKSGLYSLSNSRPLESSESTEDFE